MRRRPYDDTYNEIGAAEIQARVLIEYVRDAPINRDEAGALIERARRTARAYTHLADVLEMEVQYNATQREAQRLAERGT